MKSNAKNGQNILSIIANVLRCRIYNVWLSCLRLALCCLCLIGGLLFIGSLAQAELKAGDLLVIDPIGGTNNTRCIPFPGCGALFVVNPETGQRTVLSDFGDPVQGSLGRILVSVAVGRAGQIFVSTRSSADPAFVGGALFEVDPDTGNRTLLSNFGQGEIHGFFNSGLAVDAKGRVIANAAPLSQLGEFKFTLVRIDPETDERVLITDLSNPAQGMTESDRFISDLAVEHSGKILIGTARASGFFLESAIFRVHPVTGKRRLLSDFANAAQGADVADLGVSTGLAIETSGQILVASGGIITAPRNLLLRIDPKTGQRTVLSDFDNPAQGLGGVSLQGVAVEKSGKIIVGAITDPFVNTYALFRVNPKTGRRTLLSDSSNPAQGPPFIAITHIAVVPKDSDAECHD